jgi:hypothetical protein
MARKIKIESASDLKKELLEVYAKEKKAGNGKTCGYLLQTLVTVLKLEKEEIAIKANSRTSIDNLCDILSEMRKELYNNEQTKKNEE